MLSPLGETLRRHDPDRFLTVLFAPEARRETLVTLYAFNHELARAREVASQSLLALMRLQWWREVVEGEAKGHEVATPLLAMLADGRLDAGDLLALIEAREAEVDGDFPTLEAWCDWLLAGAGGLAVAAGRALGVTDDGVLRGLRLRGAAYGVAGLLRARLVLGRQGRAPWPTDHLAALDMTAEAAAADPTDARLRDLFAHLAEEGRGFLAEARVLPAPPRAAIAAALPAVLARRDLRHMPSVDPRPRGLGDRLAVTFAGLMGRV
ncbi:squalene/phytoene synthase family protein [Acidisoma cladoniae]|jgi:phytoene synthase|uniref:squalene/phytoene synthase family protein n=1 Tax=Acidisoma cladoniae TaxID=3040935 RepID=UPI00254EAE26|nr:squalene/phytoene synthase family protein [Acidisoma sp. PAMC 29798]